MCDMLFVAGNAVQAQPHHMRQTFQVQTRPAVQVLQGGVGGPHRVTGQQSHLSLLIQKNSLIHLLSQKN